VFDVRSLIAAVLLSSFQAKPVYAQFTQKQERLLNAIIQVESNGRDDAVGDNGNAIGCLQIWKVYWIDATEFSGIGGEYQDCFKREYAKGIFDAYMKRYAREAWTDPALFNPEKVARIHNGGPRGHEKKATQDCWRRVNAILSRSAHEPLTLPAPLGGRARSAYEPLTLPPPLGAGPGVPMSPLRSRPPWGRGQECL